MTNPIILHLDLSTLATGLRLVRANGQQATTEEALREGFTITANDAAAILTWAERFIQTREENSL